VYSSSWSRDSLATSGDEYIGESTKIDLQKHLLVPITPGIEIPHNEYTGDP
jgi:hypothetical protein